MKRTVENPDGIYPRRGRQAETPAEDRQIIQSNVGRFAARRSVSVADRLTMMKRDAAAILDSDPQTVDKGVRQDANEIASYCAAVRRALGDGKAEQAVGFALELGRAWERLHVRPHEPKVVRVNSTTRKLRQGFADEKAHDPATIKKAIALYKRILKRKPTPKKASAEWEVKQETRVPPRTLRYHLAKEKERRQ